MAKIFESVESTLVDEKYMPAQLKALVQQALCEQSSRAVQTISDATHINLAKEHRHAQKQVTLGRSTHLDCSHPLHAARASILYSFCPADETSWCSLRASNYHLLGHAPLRRCLRAGRLSAHASAQGT